MKLLTHNYELPLKHVFTISRESISTQPTLIVELGDGVHRGFGEATTNSYYGVTIENMTKSLNLVQDLVAPIQQIDPKWLWQKASEAMPNDPFALCALDQAAYDLWGKQQGQPVYQLWGLDTAGNPASSFTIGIDEIPTMVQKMQEAPAWPVYKIKLGTIHDLEIVRELRKHSQARFRVDANCGWDAEQTVRNSIELKKLNVEFIEQPLPRDDWDGAKHVYQNSALPIIADESCITAADVQRCNNHFHGINIKLVKCGGLTPARQMIAQARSLGMKVMVGCMVESTVGISAIAQLLPLLDYVDMDGAALLSQDIATGVKLEQGRCQYAQENGTGVQLLA